MKIKSYFSATVESAVVHARQELGAEAMLLSSKKAAPEARHLGEYEVVFACSGERAVPAAAASHPAPESGGNISQTLADLRRQMERMAATFEQFSSASAENFLAHPELAALFSALIAAGVDAHLAQRLISKVRAALQAQPSMPAAMVLREEFERLCCVDGRLGSGESGRKIVALVGPSGCGKTTTLTKLAVRFGLSAGLRTQLLTLDMERIGAADQLQSLAAILGVAFASFETIAGVAEALAELTHKELILIDTPGFGSRDIGAGPLAAFLNSRNDIDVHLVLPASMKEADLRRVVERFDLFSPAKLIFTRLDETDSPGSILNQIQRTGKPVSFICSGQRIPEDLQPADRLQLTNLILGEETRSVAAVAA
ncbi:MAG TPA: hypothetical protein VMZ52_01490 [Bryobacteraceae bacterium]|nr:hypothetical protein [Bryobacteraceae bacterium]